MKKTKKQHHPEINKNHLYGLCCTLYFWKLESTVTDNVSDIVSTINQGHFSIENACTMY